MIYYAHSIVLYNTLQEERDIQLLERLGFEVYSPNNEEDAEGYKIFGMGHFRTLIQDHKIKSLAFRANTDGTINAGIAKEIGFARECGKSVIELPSGITRRTLNVEETREVLLEQGAR